MENVNDKINKKICDRQNITKGQRTEKGQGELSTKLTNHCVNRADFLKAFN